MILDWKTVESREKPLEVDCTLSETGVYVRKNIREEIVENESETYTKYVYDEVILSNEFRYPILDMEEYKAKLLETLKEEYYKTNEKLLSYKESITTSFGTFSIKTPTYDFIFCLMALKDIAGGVTAGTLRYYGGEPAPAMSQEEVKALYTEFAGEVMKLDAKFTATKNLISSATSIDELFSIEFDYS